MRYILWYVIRLLWTKSSLDAFTVIIYVEKYLTPKDKRDTGIYLKDLGESQMAGIK